MRQALVVCRLPACAAQHIKHVPRCHSDLGCRLCLALSSSAGATEFLETFESCLHIQHHFASVVLATEGKKKPNGYSLFFMNHFHHALNLEFF